LAVATNEWILLYTDGIPEAMNPSEVEFGERRFREFLATERCASADQLADRLLGTLSEWSARGPHPDFDDDLTLVAIRVLGD